MNHVPYIHTDKSVTFIADGVPHQIEASHANFNEVLSILTSTNTKDRAYLIELAKPINKVIALVNSQGGEFSIENETVSYTVDGYKLQLPTSITKEILRINAAAGNLLPLEQFVRKLATNPDKEVIQQLFDFIQSCGLSLTKEGNFLAYKIVRNDFMDIYTGTMDNSPGELVAMPRFAVEKNPDKTCSAGLHFAAWNYLSSYANTSTSKVVLLSIDPADVVSIPSDYNNMKGRACKYTVLREVTKPEELKDVSVHDSSNDWIKWTKENRKAGHLPAANNQYVEVRYKSGDFCSGYVHEYLWNNYPFTEDRIKAYRLATKE